MTVILHAEASARVDKTATVPRAAAAGSASSFAAFLDDLPPAEQKNERAFGFSKLGMFGRYGAQSSAKMTDEGISGTRASPDVQPVLQRQNPPPDKEAEIISPCKIGSPVTGAFQNAPLRESLATRFLPQPDSPSRTGLEKGYSAAFASDDVKSDSESNSGHLPDVPGFGDLQPVSTNDKQALFLSRNPVSPAMDIVWDDAGEVLAGTKGGKAASPPNFSTPHGNDANTLNLTVTGSSDALAIVARSANESDAEIHERMKAVAAEFGMDIASFRLNGSPFQEMLSTSLGGRNGSRAR